MTRYNTIQDLPERYQEQAKTKLGPPPPDCDEKTWQAWVVARAKDCGWDLIYHTHNSQHSPAGFPDLIMLKYTPRGQKVRKEIQKLKPKARDYEHLLQRLRDAGPIQTPRNYVTTLVVELKTNKGRITPDQREWLTAFALITNHTHVWRPSMWREILMTLQE